MRHTPRVVVCSPGASVPLSVVHTTATVTVTSIQFHRNGTHASANIKTVNGAPVTTGGVVNGELTFQAPQSFSTNDAVKITFNITDASTTSTGHVVVVASRTPVVKGMKVKLTEDSDVRMILNGQDDNGDRLTGIVVSLPTKGTLHQVRYTNIHVQFITTVYMCSGC